MISGVTFRMNTKHDRLAIDLINGSELLRSGSMIMSRCPTISMRWRYLMRSHGKMNGRRC